MSTSDKFWDVHAQEMRKARLLQAAAVIHAAAYGDSREDAAVSRSVEIALDLEQKVTLRTGLQ